jgi:recombination protein RecT
MANQMVAQKNVSITAYLMDGAVKNQINKVVGGKDGDRFISSLMSAVATNPTLQECQNASLVNAALLGYALRLSPSPQLGHFYMVPYNDKKTGGKVAQFQLGYKGYIQLALRSGQYRKMNVLPIKEGELIHWDPLNEEIDIKLIDDEEAREKAPTIGYYASFEYLNGFRKALYWSKEKMISHADRYSQAFSKNATSGRYPKVSYADYEAGNYNKRDEWLYSSFWYKDFDGMAMKTMLRQLISKWGIMSIDMEKAYTADQGAIDRDMNPRYVDNTPEGAIASAQEEISESANTQEIDVAPETPQKAVGPSEQNAQRTKPATQSGQQGQAEAIPQPDF